MPPTFLLLTKGRLNQFRGDLWPPSSFLSLTQGHYHMLDNRHSVFSVFGTRHLHCSDSFLFGVRCQNDIPEDVPATLQPGLVAP